MSINLGKINSSKNINVETMNEDNSGFRIRHSTEDIYKEPVEEQQDLGLDFLTQEYQQEEQEEESENGNPMMDEPYNENEYDSSPQMSYEEIQQRKGYILYNLERYRKQGYELSRMFGTGHSLEELETELSRIETEKDMDNGLKLCKDGLLVFTKAIETANSIYGQNWIKLNGWTAFVMEEYKTHKYDDVFVKLWTKYKSKLPDSPEITLIWLLGTSAFVFHMSRLKAEAEFNAAPQQQFRQREMSEPSMNFDDLDSDDTNSVISGFSGTSTQQEIDNSISISIPDEVPKKKKTRGRPKKII
jgi:hypothetical protein